LNKSKKNVGEKIPFLDEFKILINEHICNNLKIAYLTLELGRKELEKFIEQTEKLMTASEKYVSGAEKELDEFCDRYFKNDTEVENYCREKHIPTNEEEYQLPHCGEKIE
jgi:hypothetical protein